MKIIVVGDGKVGRSIVEHICKEGHEVIIIDKKKTLRCEFKVGFIDKSFFKVKWNNCNI